MRIIKLVILVIFIASPFILNILRKNLFYSKSSILLELKEVVREKEREFEEMKSEYMKFFSPTKIESIGEIIGLKKANMRDYIIIE